MTAPHLGTLTLWLLDTRSLWPGPSIQTAAAYPLSLLPSSARLTILHKHHAADARMALASALLKHFYIAQTLHVPVSTVSLARRGDGRHGKPAALVPGRVPGIVATGDVNGGGVDDSESVDASVELTSAGRPFVDLDFNVSHQAGVVVLIGYKPASGQGLGPGWQELAPGCEPEVLVGIDVTCVGERDDNCVVDREGVDGFVEVFADVFSDRERREMAFEVDYVPLKDGRVIEGSRLGAAQGVVRRGEEVVVGWSDEDGRSGGEEMVRFDSELITQAKLRRFYAYFAYKEAYVKLVGEGLLADWLKKLEFRRVRSPRAGEAARMWGGTEEGVEVWLKGKRVRDTQMDLRAYDEGFMIASAVKGDAGVELKDHDIKVLDINDVMEYITTHM